MCRRSSRKIRVFLKNIGDMGIEGDYAELTSGADRNTRRRFSVMQVLYAVGGTSVILSAAMERISRY